ncbi:hypothetical protein BDZ97DRAFT_1820136 [Flammula alnicola]|nr:hypothetical protein BDZ97DRAFT_1820136 [Flammula alnicola]
MEQDMDAIHDSPAQDGNEKHIRITQQGKMKWWISVSLNFFENPEEDKSLILHTLPHFVDAQAEPGSVAGARTLAQQSASAVTSVVPRPISVVEIIKREYMKKLETTRSTGELGIAIDRVEGGQGRSIEEAKEASRSRDIIEAFSGKKHPRQIQTPFMRITLSTVEIPDLVAKGASYQPPTVRKQSKAAKARAKKRVRAHRRTSVAVVNPTMMTG